MALGPHVSESGEVKLGLTRVKLAGVDPGLVAGRATDDGEVRVSSSGDQLDGGRGYHGGAGAAASAMVRASEGEELGRKGRVCELGGGVGDRPRAAELRGEETGRRAAAWRALVPTSSTCLPAWPSQAARWSGGWAGLAGGLARWAPGKPLLCSIFLFLFFCNF